MSTIIQNPFSMFYDGAGYPLSGGHVYIGVAGQDPQTSPLSVFWDTALTIAAAQPISVIGGLICNSGSPAQISIAESNYSIRVRDADGAEVFYVASAVTASAVYQPLDPDLSAIAQQGTTAFGRTILTAPDGPALLGYLGYILSMPVTGGAFSGPITQQSHGAYPYMADSAYSVARIFVTAHGASDPRSQVGDLWLEANS